VPPLSVLVLLVVAGLGVSVLSALAAGALTTALAVWGAAFAGLVAHVAHAARLAGRGRALLRVAWSLPGYAIEKTFITISSLRRSEERWVRTLRQGEQP